MSWKTDRFLLLKNRGKETKVTMLLLEDTDSYRVKAYRRVVGQQWETFHDSIAEETDSFQVFQALAAEAVVEGYEHPTGHPMLQSVNPSAQAAIMAAGMEHQAETELEGPVPW